VVEKNEMDGFSTLLFLILLLIVILITIDWFSPTMLSPFSGRDTSFIRSAVIKHSAPWIFTNKIVQLKDKMRELWNDHVVFTRLLIVDNKGNDATINRLLRNYKDMEMVFHVYYDEDTSSKIGDLLGSHLIVAKSYLDAIVTKNTMESTKQRQLWWDNGKKLAKMLAKTTGMDDARIQVMMDDHLTFTEKQMVQRLNAQHTEELQTFDAIIIQANMMADALTEAIATQKPQLF
jgi:hypothetical protein